MSTEIEFKPQIEISHDKLSNHLQSVLNLLRENGIHLHSLNARIRFTHAIEHEYRELTTPRYWEESKRKYWEYIKKDLGMNILIHNLGITVQLPVKGFFEECYGVINVQDSVWDVLNSMESKEITLRLTDSPTKFIFDFSNIAEELLKLCTESRQKNNRITRSPEPWDFRKCKRDIKIFKYDYVSGFYKNAIE